MLKLTDTGVQIHLTGTQTANYALIFATVLGLFALVVAYLAMTQSVVIAIGGLFALAVGCFFFNLYKEKLKNMPINGGIILACPFELTINGQTTTLSKQVQITDDNGILTIVDGKHRWQLSGFENDKEKQVLKAVLLGQTIQGRGVQVVFGNGS